MTPHSHWQNDAVVNGRHAAWRGVQGLLGRATILGMAACATPALASGRIALRNCVAPELFTVHETVATLHRTIPGAEKAPPREVSVVEITSRLVRAHLDESQAGRVKVADMLLMQPARVLMLQRDGKAVSPLPGPEAFDLPIGSSSLRTEVQTITDGPVQVPPVGPTERAVLAALLDVSHWPRGDVNVGASWTHSIESPSFEGTQTFRLVETPRVADESVAVIECTIDGRFAGRLGATFKFDEGRIRFAWLRTDRVLLKLNAKAKYHRTRARGDEQYELAVESTVKSRQRLSDDEQAKIRSGLADFAAALAEYDGGNPEKAVAACAIFRDRWPESPWLPAVEELEHQAMKKSSPPPALDAATLKRTLSELAVEWQLAESGGDEDRERRNRRAMSQLVAQQESGIRAMLKDPDESVRSLAVFAWAFGTSAVNYVSVAKATSDPSARVRMWAANGLAVRRAPDTDPELLRRLLTDDEARVRARGCAAAARCLPPGEPVGGRVRRALVELLKDKDRSVRFEAYRAFITLGGPADREPLEDARKREKEPDCLKLIDRALTQISKRYP